MELLYNRSEKRYYSTCTMQYHFRIIIIKNNLNNNTYLIAYIFKISTFILTSY